MNKKTNDFKTFVNVRSEKYPDAVDNLQYDTLEEALHFHEDDKNAETYLIFENERLLLIKEFNEVLGVDYLWF